MVVRHVAAVLTGLLVATAVGLLAGLFADDRFWLHVAVFAACTSGPAYGLGWLVSLSRATDPEPVARPDETVEHDWWQRSSAGSFTDLVVVAGLVAGALAVTGLRVDATLLLAGLIALALADVAVRFTVLSRREAWVAVRNDLAERRQVRGWSQGRLAEELGVSRQTVISLEKGRFDPSLPLAFRIAAVFGCRIEDVFSPDDD